MIHGDPTNDNLIVDGNPPRIVGLIDFGAASLAPWPADIAAGLWRSGRRVESGVEYDLDRITRFVRGYHRESPVPPSLAHAIPLLIQARGLALISRRVRRLPPSYQPPRSTTSRSPWPARPGSTTTATTSSAPSTPPETPMPELPRALAEGVDRLLEGVSARDLSRAAGDLSAKYRQKQERSAPVARSQAEILAYAATRLPATFAAISAVLSEIRDLRPDWRPRTLLDLGAGPGPGLWSAAATWPSLERAVAVDAEERMIALGQRLAGTAPYPAVRSARWVRATVPEPPPDGPYDLVLLAYVLGELDAADRDRAVDHAAEATAEPAGLTVIVEPGTPEGYARVLRARERLLATWRLRRRPVPPRRSLPARWL